MEERTTKIVIYDINGIEHEIEITRKEAFGIMKWLLETYE